MAVCLFEGPAGVCQACESKNNGYNVTCATCGFFGLRGICPKCGGHTDGPSAATRKAAPSDGSGPAPPVAKKQRTEKAATVSVATAGRVDLNAARVGFEAACAEVERAQQQSEQAQREKDEYDRRKLSAATEATAAKEKKAVEEEQVPPPPPPAVHGKGEDGSNTYRCKVCKGWWDGDGATFCSRCVASKWEPAKAAREKLDMGVAELVLATEVRRRTHISVILARENVTTRSDALHDAYHDGAVQTGELVCRRCATSHLCPGDELDAKSLPFFRCKGGCA